MLYRQVCDKEYLVIVVGGCRNGRSPLQGSIKGCREVCSSSKFQFNLYTRTHSKTQTRKACLGRCTQLCYKNQEYITDLFLKSEEELHNTLIRVGSLSHVD